MKKFFIFLTLLIILYLPFFVLSRERPLEVDYPKVGNINLDTSSVTLPAYVKYIFIFALIISGLIILGTLLYGGFLYLTSAGNPIILSEAKKRILSSFLGVLILFGAYIIFNTINPQIVKPKLEPLLKPESFIDPPGIYICEKIEEQQESKLTGLLNDYKREDITVEDRQKTVKDIRQIMLDYKCEPIRNSLVLEKSRSMSNTTFFSIPRFLPKSDPQAGESLYEATTTEYGLVLHEFRDYKGKCLLLDKAASSYLYMDILPDNITENDYDGSFKSITIFKRTSTDKIPSVTLYSCLNYNDGAGCVGGDNTIIDPISELYQISEGNNITRIFNNDSFLKENVRSIQLEPEGKVFVIFYDKDTPGDNEMCEIISNNDRNLLDNYIGRCHATIKEYTQQRWVGFNAITEKVKVGSCTFATTQTEESQIQRCKPCMNSMYIIKGEILK